MVSNKTYDPSSDLHINGRHEKSPLQVWKEIEGKENKNSNFWWFIVGVMGFIVYLVKGMTY